MKEAPNVSRYEAITRGDVTAATNWSQVSVKVFRTRAASGISTIRLRYSSVYPSVRLNPGSTFLLPPRAPLAAAPDKGAAELRAPTLDTACPAPPPEGALAPW